MYFKQLQIVGFKSFFNKTTLDFEPGMTAIVGPNGCGKSNIFDSIRWVLGEQSVKAMRGAQMEDVIFNGTENKEALGMAEVSLTFDNSQRFFPMDHPEVVITRRLFRSGESEYLLNKQLVRLKDINDILMGTGIGAESYSLVQQGKIDLVLSSRPEDRRLVFDEASGISKYKAQKRETARKLEDTEQNLLRVNDIIQEVKRQITSLERQASKARRYKEAFEQLQAKEVSLAVIQKKKFVAQKTALIKTIDELQEQETSLGERIKELQQQIAARQAQIKSLEEQIARLKNELLAVQGRITRNEEYIVFNEERLAELEETRAQLSAQREETKTRLVADEEQLALMQREYDSLEQALREKQELLSRQEGELATISHLIKEAHEQIAQAKSGIMDITARMTAARNEIVSISSQQQVKTARQKRLELEKAKIREESASVETSLEAVSRELGNLEAAFGEISGRINATKERLQGEEAACERLTAARAELEKQKLSLESQREFIAQLRTKYEDINEVMNAVIYLDKPFTENTSGLVVKIRAYQPGQIQLHPEQMVALAKISGEAKPIDLDATRIGERIAQIEQEILALSGEVGAKQKIIQTLKSETNRLQDEARGQEITLANKRAHQQNVSEQLQKIRQEEEIIDLELADVNTEMETLAQNLQKQHALLSDTENEHRRLEESIAASQANIAQENSRKEGTLVAITQTRTECEELKRRIASDGATLQIIRDTCAKDRDAIERLSAQIEETGLKRTATENEIESLKRQIVQAEQEIIARDEELRRSESDLSAFNNSIAEEVSRISADQSELETLKNRLYELQMEGKDIDFRYLGIKERILQGYKTDIDTISDLTEELNEETLAQEIQGLKSKVDSYGSVNLVAIEEYDELKVRFDFLNQQQTDLLTAKESLHEAILKINRTTRKMFMETFERIREEFKNHFRLLFNGGDAQIYLLDEQDPLESGIEIICRPPGKKLQNILLLSGGEKSMSAIALIFAIFRVKPTPFCVLDEIDAALDEANVDRFSRMLQEFTKESQFIVITHNKKTIANADVMYGITMEESGVSKIVSVKFGQKKLAAENTLEPAAA